MSAQAAGFVDDGGDALAFLRRLWRLNHGLERLSSDMGRRLGVTAQQRMVVRCIGKYPGITAGQLAALLHLDPGTVSAALRRLEKRRLVKRSRDERDRRRVTLGLTKAGRALDRSSEGTVERAVERLLTSLDATALATTAAVVERLTALVDEELTPIPEERP